MTLIVETGAIVAGAESYVSSSDADTYHENRGNSAWAAIGDDDKEAALRRAADYMLQAFRTRWKGSRVISTQAMDWPRANVPLPDGYMYYPTYVPIDAIPDEVKKAQMELALITSDGTALAPVLDRRTTRETVGPLTQEFDNSAPQYQVFRNVDMLIGPFLKATGATTPLVRA